MYFLIRPWAPDVIPTAATCLQHDISLCPSYPMSKPF